MGSSIEQLSTSLSPLRFNKKQQDSVSGEHEQGNASLVMLFIRYPHNLVLANQLSKSTNIGVSLLSISGRTYKLGVDEGKVFA